MGYAEEFERWWAVYWASTRNPHAPEIPGIEPAFKEVAFQSWIAATKHNMSGAIHGST